MFVIEKKSRDLLRVDVLPETRAIIDDWTHDTGMSQSRLVGQIVDTWAAMNDEERRQWLIGLSDDDVLRRASEIQRKRAELAAGAAAAKAADLSGKKQIREDKSSRPKPSA